MKKILVAFDDSPGAEAAMQDMVRGGFPERCEAKVITIADVWLPPDPERFDAPSDRVAESRVQARQHALDALAAAREISQRGAERLHRLFPNWVISQVGHADSPAWGILTEAKKWGAALIVIGSHGRSPLQKFFLGSVSYKVAAEAQCSVRIFRSHQRHGEHGLRLLVAVDGSSDSEAAINEILAREWPAHTKVQLVTVVDPKLKTAAIMDAGVLPAEHRFEAAEDWIAPMLARSADRLKPLHHLEISTHIMEGDPKSVLVHHAENWKADCIFLGARGLQHGNRLYLGTLAAAIMTRAHCTVEIVRPASTANPG